MAATVRDKQMRDSGDLACEIVLPVFLGETAIGVLHCRPLESSAAEDDLLERLEDVGRAVFRRIAATGALVREVELTSEGSDLPSWHCSLEAAPPASARAPRSSMVRDLLGRERPRRPLDLQKDDLVAMLGHELRNPLAAIRNATELLGMMDHDNRDLARIHGVLDRQTRQTAKLIDGLLDVSRIMQGMLSLDRTVVDLGRLLRRLCADHAPACERLGLGLALELPHDAIWVEGDTVRLVQIFDNLLDNAERFTPTGGHIRVLARADERAWVRIEDDGIGIEPALLPRVFEPFCQASQNIDRAVGGLGLGLTLVRGLVDLHGGLVRAESAGIGGGSAFTIELDLESGPGPARSLPPPRGLALRVLIVEDNHDMAAMLADLLVAGGHAVEIAATGAEGIACARASHPDVVVCDLGLPGDLDGFAVAEAIRGEADFHGIGLIALTAYGGAEYRARTARAGFDACLVKPVTLEILEKQLARCARR
jgi:signal transduction histidine kinase